MQRDLWPGISNNYTWLLLRSPCWAESQGQKHHCLWGSRNYTGVTEQNAEKKDYLQRSPREKTIDKWAEGLEVWKVGCVMFQPSRWCVLLLKYLSLLFSTLSICYWQWHKFKSPTNVQEEAIWWWWLLLQWSFSVCTQSAMFLHSLLFSWILQTHNCASLLI